MPYKKSKDIAHQFYREIGKISCPYFNDECVHFTSDGFNHLIRKGRTPRPKSEQRRRFYLLHFVKNILENKKLLVVDKTEITKVKFWTFIYKTTDYHTIKVVVRRLKETGNKHFFSVMANKSFFKEISINKKSPQ